MQRSGEAVRSASACWKSASISRLGGNTPPRRQLVHALEFAHERFGAQAFVVRLLEFERNGAKALEARRVLKSALPDFFRGQAGVRVHVEPGEVVTAAEMDFHDGVAVQLIDVIGHLRAAVAPADIN